VLSDEGAMDELLALGPKQLPVVSKSGKWVNGQSLKPVADLVGIDLGEIKHLPPAELARRIDLIVDGAARFFSQFPARNIGDQLPGRPRSLAQLTWHLFNVVDAFLEHERGIPLVNDAYGRLPAAGSSRSDILAYGADVRKRFAAWWEASKTRTDWTQPAKVYYGGVAVHEFLERTTWHSGQHSRQLMWALLDRYGIEPDDPLGPEMWQGLPMPEKVWDS
jgi:DinB superfamily